MTLPLSVQEYATVFNIRSRKSSLVSLFTNSFTFTLNFQFVVYPAWVSELTFQS